MEQLPNFNFKNFLSTYSIEWIDYLYKQWLLLPEDIDTEWSLFFSGFIFCSDAKIINFKLDDNLIEKIDLIVENYRKFGHLFACTDPNTACVLNFEKSEFVDSILCGISDDTKVPSLNDSKKLISIHELICDLNRIYCHNVGIEYLFIENIEERNWLINHIEVCRNHSVLAKDEKLRLMQNLFNTHIFETLLQRHFPAQKRFSLEGGEILIPALDTLIHACPEFGITDVIVGMAHRGRLNVLTNIFNKPYVDIIAEFNGDDTPGFSGDGDVKYHKGFSIDRLIGGNSIHLTLAANPSHLEAVNSVVAGKCRARQYKKGYLDPSLVLPLQIHGDSSFAGQGIVNEIMNLSQLEGYSTGGTIHIILNNQIGFTTTPSDSRSSRYTTDSAKSLSCPIFHVQGEAPEDVLYIVKLALEYRQKFKRDVFIEIVCYRRYGHNETDEPSFTQPLLYRQLDDRLPISQIYANTLLEEGFSQEQLKSIEVAVKNQLEVSFTNKSIEKTVGYGDYWNSVIRDFSINSVITAVSNEKLVLLSLRLIDLPQSFSPHPKIHTLLHKRFESVLKDTGIDWGNAEILAYASLLDEGFPVRLSGQDSRRGTFSHRHCVLHDVNNDDTYTPLNAVAANSASFQVWDSPLSEFGVLGFEYGYSLETPYGLTIWEAQFGDFANGAQVIIDQFIASGETKWNRASGLVMYLPHGYEGQGAEHSSARIERYLQLCAGNNMILVNPTSPAQFFHVLRRQMKQAFRKPLIVFTPKSLLRHPQCVSSCEDLCNDSFHEILMDRLEHSSVRRILLCSGKIYYELFEERERINSFDTAIIRIEQLYPLRSDLLLAELSRYGSDSCFVWVQEEPENMGAWSFIRYILAELGFHFRYVGRPGNSCPAVGSHRLHTEQQASIIQSAFHVV